MNSNVSTTCARMVCLLLCLAFLVSQPGLAQPASIWRPQALVVSPDGKLVYLANDLPSNGIVVFDAQTLARLYTLPPAYPYALALSGDGEFLYTISNPGYSVSVVDTKRKTILYSLAVGLLPTSIALTPDGQKLFVGNPHSHHVTEVDTKSRRITHKFSLGSVTALAAAPDNQTVFVAQRSRFTAGYKGKDKHPWGIECIDVHSRKTRMLTDATMLTPNERHHWITDMLVTHAGDKLLCELDDGNLIVVDTRSGALLAHSMVKMHGLETLLHGQLAVAPDDSQLYFTTADTRSALDDDLCIMPLKASAEPHRMPGVKGTLLSAIAVSPDGKFVYVAGSHGIARFSTTED